MGKADRTALRAKLEDVYHQWAALGPEDGGRKQDLLGQLFETVYDLFPGHEEEINTLFLGEWTRFDAAKGTVYDFFSSRIRLREKDAYRRAQVQRQRTVEDAPVGEDQALSVLDGIPAGPGSDPEEGLRLDGTACQLIAAILELPQRLQGRANNETRHNYFRMFFTDNMVTYLHGAPEEDVLRRHERDLFAGLKEKFLDYFMSERCRSVEALCRTELKPYGVLVEGRGMEETRLPLPGDVYVSYLKREEDTAVRESAVSQQRQFYLQYLRQWIG